MSDSKGRGKFSGKWGIITLHPWLPSRTEQIARARAWGVEESTLHGDDVSALVVDDVRKVGRTTNWMSKLTERAEWLHRMRAFTADEKLEGQVFFANPLCVGMSAKVAEDTIRAIWATGMQVYVHAAKGNGSVLYKDGDDLTEFLADVTAMANAKHQSKFRRKASE